MSGSTDALVSKGLVIQDRALHARQLARRWLRQGWISQPSASQLVMAHPTKLQPKRLVFRVIEFVGVLLGGVALAAFLTFFVELVTGQSGDDFVHWTFLAVGVGGLLAALSLFRRGVYASGLDEGAWGVMIVCGASGVVFSGWFEAEGRAFWWAAALLALLPASLGYLLSSIIVWGSLSWLLLDSWDLRVLAVCQLLILWLLRWRSGDLVWHRRARQNACLQICCGVAWTLAINSYLPEFFGAERTASDWTDLGPWPDGLSIALLLLTSIAWIGLGARRLDRRLMDLGLAASVLTALTLTVGVLGWSVETSMIGVGFLLVVLVYGWRRRLEERGTGLCLNTPPRSLPWGWFQEDLENNEGWVREVLAGMQRDRSRPAERPPASSR